MTATSFTRKQLRVTLTLSNNAVFEGTNNNTLIVTGLRVIAQVNCAGAPVAPAANVQIYGLKESDMNALTMLAWKPLGVQRNSVVLEANDGSGWAEIFSGQIIEAGPNYQSAPDVFLAIDAVSLYYERLAVAPPSSYPGATDVAVIVQNLAKAMGKAFENNGVNVTLNNPYLPNTLAEQLSAVCQQAGIDLYIDSNVIAICPKGVPRGTVSVLLSPESGLIGYPTIDKVGVNVKALFNPGLRFGGPVTIKSKIPKANGDWRIYALTHNLESERPGGAWFSTLGCSEFGRLVVVSNG